MSKISISLMARSKTLSLSQVQTASRFPSSAGSVDLGMPRTTRVEHGVHSESRLGVDLINDLDLAMAKVADVRKVLLKAKELLALADRSSLDVGYYIDVVLFYTGVAETYSMSPGVLVELANCGVEVVISVYATSNDPDDAEAI